MSKGKDQKGSGVLWAMLWIGLAVYLYSLASQARGK